MSFKKICLRFIGNLKEFFGEEICIHVKECNDLRDYIGKLIRSRNLPYSLSDLFIVNEKGGVGDELCESSIVYVLRRIHGGGFCQWEENIHHLSERPKTHHPNTY